NGNSCYSSDSRLDNWWVSRWWRNDCGCRLCYGYQHDGFKNHMAIFLYWFRFGCCYRTNLIAMGIIGLSLAFIYVQIAPEFNQGSKGGGGGGSVDDQLDEILEDY